jgi:hypothetical protein
VAKLRVRVRELEKALVAVGIVKPGGTKL